ncbi:MAG: hypothetical protein M3173_01160 [Chloroflexota bacterium]|nr:hypothetical protein [Chloroflexota bacterium]
MTSNDTYLNAASSAISLLGLWYLWVFLYREYRVDLFRQRMFAVRDQLFADAAAGIIPFNSPAYGVVRTTMNGFIRFGDRLTLASLLISWWSYRKMSKGAVTYDAELGRAFQELTDTQKEYLGRVHDEMNLIVLGQVIARSPLLLLFIVPAVVALTARRVGMQTVRRTVRFKLLTETVHGIDTMAFSYGSDPKAFVG